MQVFYLVNVSDSEQKRNGAVLPGSFYCLPLVKIFQQEITLYCDTLLNIILIDVLGHIYVEDLSAKKDLLKQKFIHFKNFKKGLREALNDIILEAVKDIFFDGLSMFDEIYDVLYSVCLVRQDGNYALAKDKPFLVV